MKTNCKRIYIYTGRNKIPPLYCSKIPCGDNDVIVITIDNPNDNNDDNPNDNDDDDDNPNDTDDDDSMPVTDDIFDDQYNLRLLRAVTKWINK